jgi:hypothetical protein
MGITFEALSRHPDKLRGTIERSRPTLDTAIDSFRVQRPFLRDSAALARELERLPEFRPAPVALDLDGARRTCDVVGDLLPRAAAA